MDVHRAISERRSVRAYTNQDVPDKLLMELIEAARLAPSGNNAQPWRFMILKEPKQKLKGVFRQPFVYSAPALIVCCGDPHAYRFGDSKELRAVRDLSIASAFLVLRATELGLGTCYIGWFDKEKLRQALKLPKSLVIPYVITVGYPADKPGKRERKQLQEILI